MRLSRSIDETGARLADGARVDAEAVLVSSHAKAPAVLAEGDLARTRTASSPSTEMLRVQGQGNVFAVGDCATMPAHPRPKAGVLRRQTGPGPGAQHPRTGARRRR